jgi:hypothetical protein
MAPYAWTLNRPTGSILNYLPVERRVALFRELDDLGAHPFRDGHLRYLDSDGREIRVWVVGDLTIHYWLDHAVREVRVTQIDPTDSFEL